MTHYIAIDLEETAILGAAETADGAAKEALQWADNDTRLVIQPATPALAAQVKNEGGNIAWGYLGDGTACTIAEEETDMRRQ